MKTENCLNAAKADVDTFRSERQLGAQSGLNQNLLFAPAASLSPYGIRIPHHNTEWKADAEQA